MRKMIALSAVVVLGLAIRPSGPISARVDEADESLCVVTHVDVLPKFTAEGREHLRGFATASRQDEGAVRVEVFEEIGRPNHSTVVEVWTSRLAYDDHPGADHVRT